MSEFTFDNVVLEALDLTPEEWAEMQMIGQVAQQDQAAIQQGLAQETPERRLWRGSKICGWTFFFLSAGLLSALGEGVPEPGDRLVGSGPMFDDVSARIATLVPGGGWQGSATQAYLAQNLAQSERAKMMGDLDHLTAALISSQARAVEIVRTILGVEMGVVATAGLFCYALEERGGLPGQLLSLVLAVGVCAAAIGLAVKEMVSLWSTTSHNASNLQGLTHKLTDMVVTLPALSGCISVLSDVPTLPAQSSIARLPEETGPLAETLDVCLALADLPGSPQFNARTVPSPGFPDFGAPQLRIPQLAGVPSLPESWPGGLPNVRSAVKSAAVGALTAPPGLSLPLLPITSQLAAPLGQLAGLSGATSRLSQLTMITNQQTQMITSMAQQLAQQQATLADHVIQDGEPGGPERAPVDAATCPSQQRQPRIL